MWPPLENGRWGPRLWGGGGGGTWGGASNTAMRVDGVAGPPDAPSGHPVHAQMHERTPLRSHVFSASNVFGPKAVCLINCFRWFGTMSSPDRRICVAFGATDWHHKRVPALHACAYLSRGNVDFLRDLFGLSLSYVEAVWAFWENCGFRLWESK